MKGMKSVYTLAVLAVVLMATPARADSTVYQPIALGNHMAGGTFTVTFFGPPPGHVGLPPFTFSAPIVAAAGATGTSTITPVAAFPGNTVKLTVSGETWAATWKVENKIQTIDWVEIDLAGSISVFDHETPAPGTFRTAKGRHYVHKPNIDFMVDPVMTATHAVPAPKTVGDIFLEKRLTFFPGAFSTAPGIAVTLEFKSDTDTPEYIDCTPATAWFDMGFSLAGTGGLIPQVCGTGPVTSGSSNEIGLFDALDDATSVMVFGLAPLLAPFKGGTMVPLPQFLISFEANGEGTVHLPFVLSPIPPGVNIYLQFWVHDSGAVGGFSSSNGLRMTTQ